MDISLIHAGLAAGAALAALPVILHLFMKQTPKRIIFPALQLIRERQKRSQKKLKVKNWLLLLARMALLALMALALARPRLFSQTSLGDEEVPTAIALVFDTSLSMGYKEKPDKSLLDEAKERALRDPQEDARHEPGLHRRFGRARACRWRGRRRLARKRIEGLALHAANRPLNAALGQAYAAVVDCDRPRHEVYVLTDLARSAWNPAATVEGLDQLPKVKSGVVTYVLRLTPKEVHDVAVVEAKPSVERRDPGRDGRDPRQAPVAGAGVEAGRRVLPRRHPEGREAGRAARQRRGRGQVHDPEARPGGRAPPGIRPGQRRPDPLEFDDVRYFTFKVQPASKVVVVADLAIDAEFVRDALDPDPRRSRPARPGRSMSSRSGRRSSPHAVRSCSRTAPPSSCSTSRSSMPTRLGPAQRLRPRRGRARRRPGRSLPPRPLWQPDRRAAPAGNARARRQARRRSSASARSTTPPTRSSAAIPRSSTRCWRRCPSITTGRSRRIEGARTLLTFRRQRPRAARADDPRAPDRPRPALDDPPGAADRSPSRPRPGTSFPMVWAFYYLMNQTVPYLAGTSSEQLIYEAGQDVLLPIDPARRFKNYIVQGPDARSTDRLSPPATSDALLIVAPAADRPLVG